MTLRCVLYQPDIPQNTGAIIRTAACLGIGVDIVEPMGFVWDEKRLRRAGMDYLEQADVVRYGSWTLFRRAMPNGTLLVVLTTRGAERIVDFRFRSGDRVVVGRESAGVPDNIHRTADARVVIPLVAGRRSLNVSSAAAIALAEALRQLEAWPDLDAGSNRRSLQTDG